MSEEKRVGTPTEVHNEWVKTNLQWDPMHRSDEQHANYMDWLVIADPSIFGKGWAEALVCVGAKRGSSRPRRDRTSGGLGFRRGGRMARLT